MRLFFTPKTSPELVRHALVEDSEALPHDEVSTVSMPPNINTSMIKESNNGPHSGGGTTPPRSHSPSLVRGVSTLGRKFSRRFEKFGDSEAARKLRMASPSRSKYHFNGNQIGLPSQQQQLNLSSSGQSSLSAVDLAKKSVSRVDSFRNFFLATSTTLKTPRAVKRRSRNTEKHRQCSSASQSPGGSSSRQVDASTCTGAAGGGNSLKKSQKSFHHHRSLYGSELTLTDCNDDMAMSECQSEADLRGYYTVTEDEDDRSVVSDFHHSSASAAARVARLRSSSGNLAARLGILPENRTILNFKESGNVFNTSNGLQIKTYGLIDEHVAAKKKAAQQEAAQQQQLEAVERAKRDESPRKVSHTGQESGYGSDGATTNSSRASPRGSLEGDVSSSSVKDKIMAFQNRNETPSPPTMTKEANKLIKNHMPPLLMPKPKSSSTQAPKKPARSKLPNGSSSSEVGMQMNNSNSNKEAHAAAALTTASKFKLPPSSSMQMRSCVIENTEPTKVSNIKKSSTMIDVAIADEDDDQDQDFLKTNKNSTNSCKEYKMIRLLKESDGQNNELGIIIAKKKLPDIHPTVTGFQVVHIEPRGLIDR